MNRRPAPNPTLDIPSQGQINNLNNPTSQGASNGTIAEEEDEEEQDELAGENNNENAVASGSGLKRSPSTNTSNTLKTTIPNKKKKLDDLKGGREAFQIPQGHNIGRPIVPGSFATCSECGKKFTVSKVSSFLFLFLLPFFPVPCFLPSFFSPLFSIYTDAITVCSTR